MEFIEGEPLTDIIKQHGALPPMRASEITRQAAEGLSVAHDMGIVHRDLKPDNIMIAKGRGGADLVKVVDFGIAKAAANEAQKVTKTGMVVGTPEYMSPEQLSGDPLDARSDIYALALVAFNMFTGKLPFPGETMQESMIMRLTDEPRQLGQMKPDVAWPADLQAVMDKALARSADARYKNASEFAHDLVQAIDRMPVTSITAMGTEVLKRMSANSMHKAQTAATIQVETPKTRVASTHDEGASRPSKSRPPASPAVTPTKSKMPMMAGVAAVVVVAGGLAAWKLGGSQGASNSANSPAPTSSSDSVKPAGPSVDSQLVLLNRRAEDTSSVTSTIIMSQLEALKPNLKTDEQRVSAALTEAMAQGVLDPTGVKGCDALKRVQALAPSTSHATEFSIAFSACK
jgi:serine/threonine-protein kinase